MQKSTIVLSTPIGQAPPSRITSSAGIEAVAEVGDHVRRGGRADTAEPVRRRRGEWTGAADQFDGERMRRDP